MKANMIAIEKIRQIVVRLHPHNNHNLRSTNYVEKNFSRNIWLNQMLFSQVEFVDETKRGIISLLLLVVEH